MGRAGEHEARAAWCGPTPHLLCEGAADTHPPCEPRASPTSACRFYYRGTSVLGFLWCAPGRGSEMSMSDISALWFLVQVRILMCVSLPLTLMLTLCVCSSDAHPPANVRVHPGSRRIPVAVAHRAQAAPALVASPAPPQRLFTVVVSLRAPLAQPTI
ncbi:hypothetical protein B0H13DRAFT_649687 [Mycena leptocephala]|nr:hypothetical protein B0H13DRAFT_649687 [Mycena leptocephala]